MEDVTTGAIWPFAFDFVPNGWLKCDGSIYKINGPYFVLGSLLGNFYGGDGKETFAVPDLRGKVLLGYGNAPGLSNWQIGQQGGKETLQLDINHIPPHSHECEIDNLDVKLKCYNGTGNADKPSGNFIAKVDQAELFSDGEPTEILNGETLELQGGAKTEDTGGSESHENLQPGFVLNYCIAWNGTYPQRD